MISFHRAGLAPAWGRDLSANDANLETIVAIIDAKITKIAAPLGAIDLVIYINKALKKRGAVSLDSLKKYISLCSSVEEQSDGRYRAKFEHLAGRASQAERILLESGKAMHVADLTRSINHRLIPFGKRLVNERSLANLMSSDARFVPIGKSGEWGLSSWSINTGTIVELVKQALIERNGPMTPDEIYNYVSSRRSVSRKSIGMYLHSVDAFARTSRTHWGLADWPETQKATIWEPRQIAEFVEQLFKSHRTRRLPYRTVRQAIMEATGLSPRQARGILAVNPVIRTEKSGWAEERFALLREDYESELRNLRARFTRRKKTLRQEAEAFVRSALENAPGRQLPLATLVEMLVKKFKRIRNTYYGYISDMQAVVKYDDPETGVVVCRLREEDVSPAFAQIEKIEDEDIRSRVGRALTFLNESDVDVAMFLLSKEFEATLRMYLEVAHAKGRVHLPKGHWSLQAMIDCVDKQKIITDKATLLFLKQQRNDRAHGIMPSIAERQIMMAHAERTVSMYVDYIVLFCNLIDNL